MTDRPGTTAALPPTYRWLLAGAFISSLATFVFPFLALFLTGRGFSPTAAGLVAGFYGAGATLGGPIAGALADRVGRRPTLVGSLLMTAGCTALLAAVDAPWLLGATALLVGVFGVGYRPAASALVADVVPEAGRARAYGLLYWAHNVGISVSLLVGGTLAHLGYERLFLADAATTLLFALVGLTRLPETRPAAAAEAARRGGPGFAAVLRDRTYLGVLALLLGTLLPFGQFMAAIPLAMKADGLGPEIFGRVMALNGIIIGVLQPLVSSWVGRRDPSRVLALAAALIGAGYGAYALAGSGWGYAGATAVWSVGEVLTFPTYEALVASLAPETLRGRYQGVLGLTFGIGFAVAPPLGAALLDAAGPRTLWLACLGVASLVALGHLAAARSRRRAIEARRAAPELASGRPDGV